MTVARCERCAAHAHRAPAGLEGFAEVSRVQGPAENGAPYTRDTHWTLACAACGLTWRVLERTDHDRVTRAWHPDPDVGGTEPLPVPRYTRVPVPPAVPPVVPATGDVLVFPVPGEGNAAFGCAWVLDRAEDGDGFSRSRGYGALALVQLAPWLGPSPPEALVPEHTRALRLTHHRHKGDPYRVWVHDDLPGDFQVVGNRPPTARQREVDCSAYGRWDGLPTQRAAQWRWEHDRAAVFAEDAWLEHQEREARERSRREALTVPGLERRKAFEGWARGRPRRLVTAARRAARELLESTGPVPDALQAAVEALNTVHLRPGGFVTPSQRSELVDELLDVVWVRGWADLGAARARIDEHRSW